MDKNEAIGNKRNEILNNNDKRIHHHNLCNGNSNYNLNEPNDISLLKKSALSSMINFSKHLLQNEINSMQMKEINRTSQMAQYNNNISSEKIRNKSNANEIKCHKDATCYQCHTTPIVGDLFKCSQCSQYTLCSQCEESNYESQDHPHDFIRIRQRGKSNEIDLLLSNHAFIDHSSKLSVKLVDDPFEYTYYKDVDDFYIEIRLLNDGNSKWPRPTQLLSDSNNSTLAINPEVIKPIIAKGDECTIKVKCLDCPLGIHKLRLLLVHESTEKTIGKPMDIRVNVVMLNNTDPHIENLNNDQGDDSFNYAKNDDHNINGYY